MRGLSTADEPGRRGCLNPTVEADRRARLEDDHLKEMLKTEPGIPVATSTGETTSQPETVRRHHLLPPYAVILHNDDVNEMGYVAMALLRSVPELTRERAVEIMLTAHHQGQAVVIVCPLELAELYRERLEGYGLTSTIEKA